MLDEIVTTMHNEEMEFFYAMSKMVAQATASTPRIM